MCCNFYDFHQNNSFMQENFKNKIKTHRKSNKVACTNVDKKVFKNARAIKDERFRNVSD